MMTQKTPATDAIKKLHSEIEHLTPAEKAKRMETIFAKVNDENMTNAEFRAFVTKTLSGE